MAIGLFLVAAAHRNTRLADFTLRLLACLFLVAALLQAQQQHADPAAAAAAAPASAADAHGDECYEDEFEDCETVAAEDR